MSMDTGELQHAIPDPATQSATAEAAEAELTAVKASLARHIAEKAWLQEQLDDRSNELDAAIAALREQEQKLEGFGDRLGRLLHEQAETHRHLDWASAAIRPQLGDAPAASLDAVTPGPGAVAPAAIVDGLYRLLVERAATNEEAQRFSQALLSGRSVEETARDILLTEDGRTNWRNRARFADTYERERPFPASVLPPGDPLRIKILDVGAQILSFMDHVYAPIMRDGRCDIVGFEPLEAEAEARRVAEPSTIVLPHFIGDGGPGTFHINAYNPTSSLYPSNPAMDRFRGLSSVLPTQSTVEVSTTRLDDLPEAAGADFLKIDVQGGELKVLMGANRVMTEVVAIHCEAEFEQVYLGQPLFCDINSVLTAADFELIDLIDLGYDTYKVAPPGTDKSRLLWADSLYVRAPTSCTNEQLMKAAYIVHSAYRKYDLAAFYLSLRDERLGTSSLAAYQASFASADS
jgi:FkbM family methyltransferase